MLEWYGLHAFQLPPLCQSEVVEQMVTCEEMSAIFVLPIISPFDEDHNFVFITFLFALNLRKYQGLLPILLGKSLREIIAFHRKCSTITAMTFEVAGNSTFSTYIKSFPFLFALFHKLRFYSRMLRNYNKLLLQFPAIIFLDFKCINSPEIFCWFSPQGPLLVCWAIEIIQSFIFASSNFLFIDQAIVRRRRRC